MPIELKMPALSPTMEEGTLAKWLVKEGDEVKSGDILAEIETDKATMEFEAVDEGKIAKILVPEGTDGVKVGAPIAIMAGEGEDASAASSAPPPCGEGQPSEAGQGEGARRSPISPSFGTPSSPRRNAAAPQPAAARAPPRLLPRKGEGDRIKASPLARRLRRRRTSTCRRFRAAAPAAASSAPTSMPPPARRPPPLLPPRPPPRRAPARTSSCPAPIEQAIPHEAIKLCNIRKTIARRLTESKQQIPHIYLTVDIQLDALLKLRGELNKGLESRSMKLSVNDLMIKALALALIEVPECNVAFAGDQMFKYSRADISVAVSIPAGLITPIIVGADSKSVSAISTEMKDLAGRAKDGKLQPQEYQGGTAASQQHGHVRDQAVRSGHQPAAGHDHGHRRGREAALRDQRHPADRDRDERHRQLRPPRHRRRRRREADAGVQAAGRKPAGDARLAECRTHWGGDRALRSIRSGRCAR